MLCDAFAGPVTNAGTLSLGTRTLNVAGSYTQTASGTLRLNVNGFGAGQFGRVAASGALNLDGTLDVTMGFAPMTAEDLQLLSGASTTGSFASTKVRTLDRRTTIVTYSPGGVVLSLPAPTLFAVR
jgi:hypothetical protein